MHTNLFWFCLCLALSFNEEICCDTDYTACETTRMGMLTYANVCVDALPALIWRVDYLCFLPSDPLKVPTTEDTPLSFTCGTALICIYAKSVCLVPLELSDEYRFVILFSLPHLFHC